MKKTVKYSVLILLSAAVTAAVVWGAAAWISCRKAEMPQVPGEVTLGKVNQFAIGETLPCSIEFKLPFCGKVTDIKVETSKHCVLSGSPTVKNIKYGFASTVKKLEFSLMAVSPGATSDGKLDFKITLPRKTQNFSVKIPLFTVSEPTVSEVKTLQLANEEKILIAGSNYKTVIAVVLVVLLAAAMLIVLYFTCFRKRQKQLSEWEKTRGELLRLKSDVEEERITPASGFIRLTDLVRSYLEKRFGLPATRRTTPEFLEDISGNSGFFPERNKPFLKNFLNAADRVKFAKETPDRQLLSRALNEAVLLVEATRPEESEVKKDV